MGISKKKFKKQTKITGEELEAIKEAQKQTESEVKPKQLDANSLFQETTTKSNLREKREKLKADRFKAIEAAQTSKTETVLVKRFASKIENIKQRGLEDKVVKKPVKKEDLFGGELEDVWAEPTQIKSKKFEQYK